MIINMLSLGRLVLCAVDVYMIYRFMKSMFMFRTGKKLRFLFFFLTTLTMFLVNAYGKPGLNLMIVPVLLLMFSLCTYEISIGQGILYTIIYYAIFGGGKEIAYELLLRMLSARLTFEIPQWFAPGGIIFLLPEYLLSFLILLLIERSTKKLDIRKNKEMAWYLLMMPVSSFIVLCSFLYMDFPESPLVQRLMCVGSFLLYFSNAAVFIILAKYTIIMNRIKSEELHSMKQSMEDEKSKNTEWLNKRNRNYIHDTRKYFNSIRMLALNGDNNKIVTVIDELMGKLQEKGSSDAYGDSTMLNAILTEYILMAEREGIDLEIHVDEGLKLDFISDSDMISMFGNLLDNAMEAVSQCESGSKKVSINMYMGNAYMMAFDVANTYKVSAPIKGNQRLTTKEDSQSHGLGIGIVENLAEEYGGYLMIEENNETFRASLVIATLKQ